MNVCNSKRSRDSNPSTASPPPSGKKSTTTATNCGGGGYSEVASALICLEALDEGVPLVSATTGEPCRSMLLEAGRPYTLGRSRRSAQLVFRDSRVSKRHCQLLFDACLHKVCLLHGSFSGNFNDSSNAATSTSIYVIREFRNRLVSDQRTTTSVGGRFRASLNGVFVNGVEVMKGSVVELSGGDEVMLVCANKHGLCGSLSRVGFVIQRIVFWEKIVQGGDEDEGSNRPRAFSPSSSGKINGRVFALRENECEEVFRSKGGGDIYGTTIALLTYCRSILHSTDPISLLRQHAVPIYQVNGKPVTSCNSDGFGLALPIDKLQSDPSIESVKAKGEHLCPQKIVAADSKNITENNNPDISLLDSEIKNNQPLDFDRQDKWGNKFVPSPGKTFYLNRLKSVDSSFGQDNVVSLPELLHPLESISRIFITTFTSDILWFLSYCEVPYNLPVTIACHNTERCWGVGPEKRSSVPYPTFPNLVVVFPSFPESIAFGKDSKKHGIACHHPKLLVLQREGSIRVIITSANLVEKQWNSVTNTIWWQDFPRRSSPDYLSLFPQLFEGGIDNNSKSDFAAQLAGFVASLVIDVPSQAHWIVELTKYDFGGALGYLIASVPGIHSYRAHSDIERMQFLPVNHPKSWSSYVEFLGSVETSIVGLGHLFWSADKSGANLKKLAAFIGSCYRAHGMSKVVIRRNKNIPADANAVSIFIANPEVSEEDCVQLGFLPRNVAKWVSALWDVGFFRFSGYVYPKEALAAASGGNGMKVHLILQVSQGPTFEEISNMMQLEHAMALCSLLASVQRCTGLWRLEQILNQCKWPEALESDFIYGASSIGSSVSAQFLAAFSSAAGKKRSYQSFDSEESDPEWNCWNASEELKSPSMRIIYPTINRVKNACSGILPSRQILCFSEKTWERIKTVGILNDAIPHPCHRVGHPMHVKVARRRFESKFDGSSFGWVYSGSHNFSAAAWGRPISSPSGTRLHVCNYELGIVFVFPPPQTLDTAGKTSARLDDIVLPFAVPAPKYGPWDRPATKKAMWEAMTEAMEREVEVAVEEAMEENPDEEEEVTAIETVNYVAKEEGEENTYAEVLWSQVDSFQSR